MLDVYYIIYPKANNEKIMKINNNLIKSNNFLIVSVKFCSWTASNLFTFSYT